MSKPTTQSITRFSVWPLLFGVWMLLASDSVAAPKEVPFPVVSTVGMVHDIVVRVGGDKVRASVLLGAGVDPHLYKPSRDDVTAILRAEMVFYNGLYLEGKMADTLTKVGRTKPVFAVSEELDPTSLLTPEGAEGHKDPHVWMNPLLWAKCAEAVARRLGEYDPVNRQMYLENAAKFVEECEVLHRYGTKVLATIPEKSRVLISSHDAFNYFGKAFGIEVLGVQGLSTESEAGLQRINQLVDLIVAREVAAVFVESSVSSKSVEALVAGVKARGRTLRIGGELFSDAMGATGTYEGTYVGMLEHNITLVARGLGGDAPKTGFSGKLSHVP